MRLRALIRARCAISGSAHPQARLELERLEDRVVPSLPDGTILVATAPSSYSSLDQSSFPTGIIGVDPMTGAQFPISTGNLFSAPTYICETPDGQLYVTDQTAFGTGAVIRVDPNTGNQFLVATGEFINGPIVLTFVNGYLYVANEGDSSGSVHTVVQIDPYSGQQRLVTSGGGFTLPVGIVPAPGNNVYVCDEPGGFSGPDPGGIWEINLTTGVQTQITHAGYINHPVDMAVEPSGYILTVGGLSATQTDAQGRIVRTNPQTGAQTVVSEDPLLYALQCIAVDENSGAIFLGAISAGTIPGKIYVLDPVTGVPTTITSDSLISLVEGIRIFHPKVQSAATTTTIASSVNPSVFGQGVIFTAKVSAQDSGAGTPTGTVQFKVDGNNFGSPISVTTLGGVTTASFSTTLLAAGTHTMSAFYSGDGSFASSVGLLTDQQLVNIAGTNITVGSSANPSYSGQSVTFTATLGVIAPGAGTPTGTVQFQIDGTNAGGPVPVTSSGGLTTAPYSTTLAAGTHTIIAIYRGDNSFTGSTGSLVGGQVVNNQGVTNTSTAVSSSANPSVFGQVVTFSATISIQSPGSGTPTGTVLFQVDGNNLGGPVPVTNSGGVTTALLSTSTLSAGTHTITATYSGDSAFGGSTGFFYSQVVNKASTSISVSSSGNPSVSGQNVTFTATISVQTVGGGAPTGTVQFQVDGTNFGGPLSVTSSGGVTTASFSTSMLPYGVHTITAVYSGDSAFGGSIGFLDSSQVVNKASTTLALTSSGSPSVSGQNVTFTAIISVTPPGAGTPTGTVQFQIDGTPAGAVYVTTTNGVTTASFSSSTLAAGTHTVTASYSGDASFASSTGFLAGGQVINNTGNVTVTLDPSTGLLSINGDTGNNAITLERNSSGALLVAGVGTLVNLSTNPLNFSLSSITGINISLLNGNDSVTMNNFGLRGNISIIAGSGSDTFSLGTVTANTITISATRPGKDSLNLNNLIAAGATITVGDNATVSLSGVNSGDFVKLTAGNNATVYVSGVTAAGDLNITVGDNAQSVTIKATSSHNLNVLQTGTSGSPLFDLENDTVHNNLNFTAGDGNNSLVLSHLSVAIQLLMNLGAGKNAVTADHVTAFFGYINGGSGGDNSYFDGGGNSGYSVIGFKGH